MIMRVEVERYRRHVLEHFEKYALGRNIAFTPPKADLSAAGTYVVISIINQIPNVRP